MEVTTTTIISALSTLSSSQLSDLTLSIFSYTHYRRRRLSTLLSSPTLFSLSLHHLHSLSLSQKSHLISLYLLSSLSLLTHHFHPPAFPHHPSTTAITPRDLDAVELLLLLCEVRQHHPQSLDASPAKWRRILITFYSDSMLKLSGGVGVYNGALLIPFIETVTRCLKFVGVVKSVRKVGASPAAVVGLPSVEVREGGVECAVCRVVMSKGRDVCRLPCQHLFHWICILPWLRKTNTCPCCRFQLPTDDVFVEIQRLCNILIKASCRTSGGDQRT